MKQLFHTAPVISFPLQPSVARRITKPTDKPKPAMRKKHRQLPKHAGQRSQKDSSVQYQKRNDSIHESCSKFFQQNGRDNADNSTLTDNLAYDDVNVVDYLPTEGAVDEFSPGNSMKNDTGRNVSVGDASLHSMDNSEVNS